MARSAAPSAPSRARSNPPRTGGLILLILATALSAWLAAMSLASGRVPGCETGGCASVLASKWSKVFGVPVGLFGALTYLALTLLGRRPFGAGSRGSGIVGGALVILIPAAALWFAALQLFVLKAFCPWCTTTHVVATAGALLLALAWHRDRPIRPATGRRAPARTSPLPPASPAPPWGLAAAAATVVFAAFVTAQVLSPTPPPPRVLTATMPGATPTAPAADPTPAATPTSPASTPGAVTPPVATATPDTNAPRRVVLHGGRFSLDPHAFPVNGSPDAQYLAVMMSDYTCKYCRAAHKLLLQVRESFDGNRLGFIMLPSHHGGDSQKLQEMMLAAWKIDPTLWQRVSDDLYGEHLPLDPVRVRQVLDQDLGADRLEASLAANAGWITSFFNLSREIHAANRAVAKSGSIPQFVFGQQIIVGAPADAAEIFDLLAQNLGLVRDHLPEFLTPTNHLDLGRVFAGTLRSIVVPFSNPGQAPLEIGRARLPTGSRIHRGLQVPVPPGQTSVLEFAFAVPRDEGPFEESLTLFANTRTSAIPMRLTGRVYKPIRIDPPFLDFGRLDAENPSTQGVLRIELADPAVLESVRSQNPGFQAELREITPGRSYEVHVETTSRLGTGAQQGVLLVSLRKPPPPDWPENIALAARATVERAVTAVPPRLLLPVGPLPSERHHQFLVRCTDGSPGFAVLGAVLEGGPAFTQPQVQPAGATNSFLVLLTLPAGWALPTPPLSARLLVQTSHPRYPTLEIPLTAD